MIEKGDYEQAYQVIREANPFPSVCSRVCDRKCETRCNLAVSGGEAVAVRALKRFVTDRVDPSAYRRPETAKTPRNAGRIAVIGAGPAGLAAAHYLSRLGHQVTVFDAGDEPGGMLVSCIPTYRLPIEVLRKEIASLLDSEHVALKNNTVLGRDMTLDDLFDDGFKAVFVAIGADKSQRLGLEGETIDGIYSSMEFLKAFNLHGKELAKGHVGIVGGGNSAVDAARVAMRQKDVKSVTLLYRRTCQEMPAYAEEVEAAQEEGIKLETLVSPIKIRYIGAAQDEGVTVETFVEPVQIDAINGHLADIRCVRNKLGDFDSSGRRRPVPMPGSDFTINLDTLIVAIGERPDSAPLAAMGLEMDKNGRVRTDAKTLMTTRKGVFAGGDLVTGPNTVVDAIAAGKKAASVIDRYLSGRDLAEPPSPKLPDVFVEPAAVDDEEPKDVSRAEPAALPAHLRQKSFAEVELSLTAEQARCEAGRCLRCDLEFTRCKDRDEQTVCAAMKEDSV